MCRHQRAVFLVLIKRQQRSRLV